MLENEARSFLELNESFTIGELKKAFRKQSFKVHPDHGGSNEQFDALKKAYGLMKKLVTHELGLKAEEIKTTCGVLLSELGGGLDPMINAVDCEICNGKGYKIFYSEKNMVDCEICNGSGIHYYSCKKCHGTGNYMHSATKKVIGKCNLCGGSGKFYPRYKPFKSFPATMPHPRKIKLPNGNFILVNNCKVCNGIGNNLQENKNKPSYEKCWVCEGKGEIQIYNPVIPKGLLTRVINNKEECCEKN